MKSCSNGAYTSRSINTKQNQGSMMGCLGKQASLRKQCLRLRNGEGTVTKGQNSTEKILLVWSGRKGWSASCWQLIILCCSSLQLLPQNPSLLVFSSLFPLFSFEKKSLDWADFNLSSGTKGVHLHSQLWQVFKETVSDNAASSDRSLLFLCL